MARPLVTIISPTYNQERFVAACAESALAQTYTEWEQIFVDDGSSDGTRDVLARFRDPRIRVVVLPHAGLGALDRTYNAALAVARGSLIAILEGDDCWAADKLAVQVPSFEDASTFLSWGRAELIDERGALVGEAARLATGSMCTRIPADVAFRRLTRSNFLTPTVTVMVRRTALERSGGFRQSGSSLLVDLPTWLWATATQDGHVAFLNHPLGRYRVHGAQTSQRRRAQMTREHFAIVQAVVSELDTSALARVQWDERARRSAESRARLAEGEVALETGEFRAARAAFLRALGAAPNPGDRALSAVGVLSSILRRNLVRSAFSARARLQRVLRGRPPVTG